jgi:hypothetical protein
VAEARADRAQDARSGGVAPQAYLIASSVELELQASNGTVVYQDTISPSPTPGGSFNTNFAVPTGSGYVLQVDVSNAAVPAANPVVSGTQGGITVNEGATTNVTVTVFPTSTTALTEGTASSAVQLAQNGEQWFTAAPTTSGSYDFSVSSTGASDAGLYLFGADGVLIDSADAGTATEVVTAAVTAGTTYFVGILENNATTASDTFSVLFEPSPADFGEPNDSLAEAEPINADTVYAATVQDTASDWYEISVPNDSEVVDITVTFTHSFANIDVELLDGTSTVLDGATSATDNETINYRVAAGGGTYYIRIYMSGGTSDTAYSLQWSASAPPTGNLGVTIQ